MLRSHTFLYLGILLALAFKSPSASGESFNYSELQIKDLEEMTNSINIRVQKAKFAYMKMQAEEKEEEGDRQAVEILREATYLILSRPNDDNMLSKLMPLVRSELSSYNAFEDTLTSITQESIRAVANEKLSAVNRGTHLFVLENILSEFRPEIVNNEDLRKIFEIIRDANIKLPSSVKNERILRSMYKSKSPSTLAATILKEENSEAIRSARAARAAELALKAKKLEKKQEEEADGLEDEPK